MIKPARRSAKDIYTGCVFAPGVERDTIAKELESISTLGRTAILIPAYKPDGKLLALVDALTEEGFGRVLVVNDGSPAECDPIFDNLKSRRDCIVLAHEINRGKGRALKTGLRYFSSEDMEERFIITCDADGQHDPASIRAVAETLLDAPSALALGVRDFNARGVPALNRMGNLLTVKVVGLLTGKKISDTQTGLRGMGRDMAKAFLNVDGERFEYETNMLLYCKNRYEIAETPIRTIYIEDNQSSHFNRLRDSVHIYFQLIKFASASLLATVIDIAGFALLFNILSFSVSESRAVFLSTLAARAVSMLFNYYVNHNRVFRSKKKPAATFIPYIALAAANIFLSAWLVNLGLTYTGLSSLTLKILANTLLFFANYFIQKKWVF